MKEKFEVIAENLHLKGWTKYLALAIFLLVVLFFFNKILSIKPTTNKKDIVFKLNGAKIITIYEYDKINDLGVIATDENGKDISSKVIKIGDVDTSKKGIYDITYKLNTNGKQLMLERTYVVLANEGAYIELQGSSIINLSVGGKYIEPGYKAIDYKNGEVTDKVKVTNNINTNVPGEYQVIYSFIGSDEEEKKAIRTVRVHESLPNSLELTLFGNSVIDLQEGNTYNEPGYKAIDETDGDITQNVTIESDLNTKLSGLYTIKYTIINSSGIQKTKNRIIRVVKKNDGILNFVLDGNEEMSIEQGEKYIEPGYMAIDSKDGNITNKVVVTGNVDTTKVGTYTIKYSITNSTGTTKELVRQVTVRSKKTGNITFTLLGNKTIKIDNGGVFNEPGYKATDTIDGNITNKVIVTGKVNTKLPGTYTIKYSITNSTGITKTLERNVIVSSDLTITLTNKTSSYIAGTVDILVEVSGDDFKELHLPDGTIISSTTAIFKANKNGEYIFKAYNKNGREFQKTIKVTNVDTEGPTGSCIATINVNKTKASIVVKGTDTQSGIKEYQYIVDGYSTSKTSQSTYTYNSNLKEAYVKIFDNAGNENKIKCNIVEQKQEVNNSGGNSGNTGGGSSGGGNTTNGGTSSSISTAKGEIVRYWIYVPDDYSSEKKPLLVFLHGSAECGKNLSSLNNYAFGKYTKTQKYDAVILMPQIQSGTWSNEQTMDDLKDLIDTVVLEYNVDTSRISISGHSLGGIGTYAMINRYPTFFSAAAPISGKYLISSAEIIAKTPVWAIHGGLDTNVSYQEDYDLIERIKVLGGNANMTTFANYGHGITDKALTETDIVNWLLTSKR